MSVLFFLQKQILYFAGIR